MKKLVMGKIYEIKPNVHPQLPHGAFVEFVGESAKPNHIKAQRLLEVNHHTRTYTQGLLITVLPVILEEPTIPINNYQRN